MRLQNRIIGLLWTFFFIVPGAICYGKSDVKVPELLAPWVDWALYNHEEELLCSSLYNDAETVQCSWPTDTWLSLDSKGGDFQQSWYVQSESWVLLPGSEKHWPGEVSVDDNPVMVLSRKQSPAILLQPGPHTVIGSFQWSRLPEFLQIPPQSALVSLTVSKQKIDFPNIDESGRVWLKTTQKNEMIENRLQVESFRLIDDRIPQQVTLYATLDIAGSAREITLGPLYLPETFIPISLVCSLPAKLEQDGKMRVQVRPGRYSLTLTLRHTGSLQTLVFQRPDDSFWPQQEIWSFQARPNLRIVEIEGVVSIDPQQTNIPQSWQNFPAYRMLPGDTMTFREIKRGDPKPAPDQLTLERTLWLRFDGSGYTVQDIVQGQKNTDWRLEMNPAITLGRVAVDGVEQFITRQKNSTTSGVELRKGILNLTADSSLHGGISAVPATGWEHEFQSVKGKLHLPPGWKLINAGGIDNIPGTWVKRWTLLDFFIVLIFTLAAAKIFSKTVAGVGFVTLILLYHEPGAPVSLWLALLVGFAVIKQLQEGTLKKIVKMCLAGILLLLVVTAIPYSIHAIRIGIYPQLAQPWVSMSDSSVLRKNQQAVAPAVMAETADVVLMEQVPERPGAKMLGSLERKAAPMKQELVDQSSAPMPYYRSQAMQFDPKAITQTGPGLPSWEPFETIPFSWSGPVTGDQMMSFILFGPRINMVLSFVRVFLIILLALGMCGVRYDGRTGFRFTCSELFLPLLLIVVLFASPDKIYADEIPSQEMLNTLQARMLEQEDCFPSCADIPELTLSVQSDQLIIFATIHAQVDTAVPLPGNISYWLPQEVLVDQQPAKGLFRYNELLWVLLDSGSHSLTIKGAIRKQNMLQLPFPLKPHRLSVKAKGWSVEGIHSDGGFDAQLQFKRIAEEDNSQAEILATGILPSFAIVERKILLGLVWKVETTVRRISPPGSAMVLDIPLLPGESVTTQGIRVENTMAKINLQSDQTYAQWESFLDPSDTIVLHHARTDEWTEIWKVDVSPVFHLESSGIPVILHKTGERWYPTWHPWPGEEVVLHISRPEGVNGQTLTIEKSQLELRPGQRSTTAKLALTIKASQGGQHTVMLPMEAALQEILIGGKAQPIRQDGRNVVLPIVPGTQEVELQWREPRGINNFYRTSEVDLGVPSVNAGIDVYLPHNRWPLFMGGEHLTGPAVLFWSVLLIVIVVAFALAKTGLTPLKFHHWLLLGIGMSMSNQAACLIVVGWLMALEFRPRCSNVTNRRNFNLIQAGIVMLTVLALASLLFAISQGLLGNPDMNIIGNGSRNGLLRWYHDTGGPVLPKAWIISIPMLVYRLAMLGWALWISFGLIYILKWGWKRFTDPVLWRDKPGVSKMDTAEE